MIYESVDTLTGSLTACLIVWVVVNSSGNIPHPEPPSVQNSHSLCLLPQFPSFPIQPPFLLFPILLPSSASFHLPSSSIPEAPSHHTLSSSLPTPLHPLCSPPPLPLVALSLSLPVGRASNHVGCMSGLAWHTVCLRTTLERTCWLDPDWSKCRNSSIVVGKQGVVIVAWLDSGHSQWFIVL